MSIWIPSAVRPLFVEAGWHPDRRVSLPSLRDMVANQAHPALELLESVAGLRVGVCDRGEECAAGDIDFGCWGGMSVPAWERELQTELIEIAQVSQHCASLYVASDGRCFSESHIHDLFAFQGDSFGIAVERVLLGRRCKPMLRADQASVWCYGVEFDRSSPEVYDPSQGPSS